ncbi:replication-associated recombination protein A, partial [Acinetobacter nosocomialis]
ALLSRCQVYTLNSLDSEAIQTLLNNALQNDKFLKERYIHIEEYDALLQFAARDARKALNLLDLIASTFEPEVENMITNAVVVKVAQQNIARYDK